MSEMIKRVARAIMHADGDPKASEPLSYQINRARAAIEAMRDPGDDFIWNAVSQYRPMLNCIRGHDLGGEEAVKVYQAVIDAVLKEIPND